ncbi:hypothetical protein ACP4OV_022057 [Aristida adscensionis]
MASTSITTTAALSMKLLIDSKAKRVLFAEASKDVVDFLFSLLSLPLATAAKLLGGDAMVGCVGNLCASVERLDSTYVLPGAAKEALLFPFVFSPAATARYCFYRPPPPPPPPPQPKFFGCIFAYGDDGCSPYVTDARGTKCPDCGEAMTVAIRYVPPSSGGGSQHGGAAPPIGFVQGVVTYTVMDDLTVAPMSAISCITLLNAFAVRDIGDLQEKTVQLGYNEGLGILKASLQSKTVLTDVFLGGNKGPGRA